MERRNFMKTAVTTLLAMLATLRLSGCNSNSSNGKTGSGNGKSKVFMTKEITPNGLMAVYEALGRKATGKVAVKISTGEPGGHNFLSPDLIKNLVQSVNGTIVECNTAYEGKRFATASHRQAAIDHGFTAIAPVDIMDEESDVSIPLSGGRHLNEDIVGAHFRNYDFFVILSHFKGHQTRQILMK
jgi:uncharacterized Fe-S center protein